MVRKGSKMMKRRTYLFFDKTIEKVEREANKRIGQNTEKIGKVRTGSVARDIICIAIERSFAEIQKMTKEEFEQEIARCKIKR